jgi:CheY-like chemotaxis protein
MEQTLPSILVIDDEPDMCWVLANILEPAGYTVTTVAAGNEALGLISNHEQPYAAAFVDAKLPDMDGLELVALIRRQSPRTGVVLISGYYYEEDKAIVEGLDSLFVGFVSKPFNLREVRLVAQKAVAQAWAGNP